MEFSGSRAISDTFDILKQRIGPLIGLLMVFFVIQFFAAIVFGVITGIAGMAGSSSELALGSVLISIVSNLVNFYLSSASSAAMMSTASPITKSSFSEAFSSGFRAAPWLLLTMLLMVLGYFVAGLALALVGFGVGAIAGQAAGVLLALVIGLPALIFVGTKLSLITPIVAVDGVHNPIDAIRNSWRMTTGATLKILLILMGFGLVAIVLMLIFVGPALWSIISAARLGQTPDIPSMVGSIGLAFLGVIVLAVLLSVFSAALIAAMHSQLSSDAQGRYGETFS